MRSLKGAGWSARRLRVRRSPPVEPGAARRTRRSLSAAPGSGVSLTIPAARAFDPAAGGGEANLDSSGGTFEVSN